MLRAELRVGAPAPGGRWILSLSLAWCLLLSGPAPAAPANPGAAPADTGDDAFVALVAAFAEANFREKEALAERMLATGHPRVRDVLTALLEDRLFERERDGRIFVVESNDERLTAFQLLDPASLDAVEAVAPDLLRRIITNNRLRRFLRGTIARFSLSSASRWTSRNSCASQIAAPASNAVA